jgi:hypothetical protein
VAGCSCHCGEMVIRSVGCGGRWRSKHRCTTAMPVVISEGQTQTDCLKAFFKAENHECLVILSVTWLQCHSGIHKDATGSMSTSAVGVG